MLCTTFVRLRVLALGLCVAGLSGSSSAGAAEAVSGQARAVQATFLEDLGASTTVLSDTGTLNGSTDARDSSAQAGSIPSLLTTGVLHATAIGWPDQVASEASIANLAMTVGGMSIGADFVMSRARAESQGRNALTSQIDGLTINGVPVDVSGAANQTIPLAGGRIVLNERQSSSNANTVTALHVVIDGVADVVIASATASVR